MFFSDSIMSGVRILVFTVFLFVLVFICCCKEAEADRGRKCDGIKNWEKANAKKMDIVKNKGWKNGRPL
jgi:hypothetical protein